MGWRYNLTSTEKVKIDVVRDQNIQIVIVMAIKQHQSTVCPRIKRKIISKHAVQQGFPPKLLTRTNWSLCRDALKGCRTGRVLFDSQGVNE